MKDGFYNKLAAHVDYLSDMNKLKFHLLKKLVDTVTQVVKQFEMTKIKEQYYCLIVVGSINEYFSNNKKILQASLNFLCNIVIILYLVLTLIVCIDKARTVKSFDNNNIIIILLDLHWLYCTFL